MPRLEELVCSFDVPDYFSHPPPNLKRLAITMKDMLELHWDFCFSISTLETLYFLRPYELCAAEIDEMYRRYRGHHLDIVLVDVHVNHVTPQRTRNWEETDRVTIWEMDVPRSHYREDDMILCDGWIWLHGVQGTLWTQVKRRMTEWRVIEQNLMAMHDTVYLS
jgi:hypothetical protein